MTEPSPRTVHRTTRRLALASGVAIVTVTAVLGQVTPAAAAPSRIGLGVAKSFAVLAGSTVTNVGTTEISGSVGVSPGAATPGLSGAMVTGGRIHRNDATAASAQSDLTIAYNTAAGRGPATAVPAELGGRTLEAGVYSGPTLAVTGRLTLNAQGNPAAVFVFQSASTLLLASSSRVRLINGADACNVFWQVGSSATLGAHASFAGSVLALTSITAVTGATVRGRLLARTGAVTLDDNRITRPDCATPTAPSTGPSSGSTAPKPPSGAPTTHAGSAPSGGGTSSRGGTSSTAPTAGSIGPSSGPESGGTTVRLTGTGFVAGATTVTIGGTTIPASDVHVESSTVLTFVTPARSASRTTVVITTRNGSTPPTTLTFTYVSRTPLAATGSSDLDQTVGAAALIALGGLILLVARKRTRGRHHLG